MKKTESYTIDVENAIFLNKNGFIGRKSALVNSIFTQIREQIEKDPSTRLIRLEFETA